MTMDLVRMRGQDWAVKPETADRLEAQGVIWRDHDCEERLDEGRCFGVVGESEGNEEAANARLVELAEDALPEGDTVVAGWDNGGRLRIFDIR